MPDYARQTLNAPNPIARFAHRRRYAVSLDFTVALANSTDAVLDYGCGEGNFLTMLGSRRPDLNLVGFDPFSSHEGASYRKVTTTAEVDSNTVDLLTCFETLEHLDASEAEKFLTEASRLLSRRGELLLSVPIIGGPTLLLKEANRMVLHRRGTDYTAKELAAAAFLGRPARRASDIKASHKGYDFRSLSPLVCRSGFSLTRQLLSPFPKAPWWANSQVFYVFAQS